MLKQIVQKTKTKKNIVKKRNNNDENSFEEENDDDNEDDDNDNDNDDESTISSSSSSESFDFSSVSVSNQPTSNVVPKSFIGFDAVALSLVLNFEPSAEKRGDMIVKASQLLKPNVK